MKLARLFPVFSATFAVIYAPALYYNWAAVTYQPATGEWDLGPVTKQGPPMFWYGNLITAFVGACIVTAIPALLPELAAKRLWSGLTRRLPVLTAIAALLPESAAKRLWSGLTWLLPVAALIFIVYILRPYFLS